jgi:hypothetical protein
MLRNDTARDWIAALPSQGAALVSSALESVAGAQADDYVDADASHKALAAAELVAAAHKDERSRLTKEAADWCLRNDATIVHLTPLAAKAVRRVLTSSELLERWRGSPIGFPTWRAILGELLAILER